MGQDLWAGFAHDPRERAHAGLRASDGDRERIRSVLVEAFADGRLGRDELDERCAAAVTARTLGDLPPLVADLVPVRPARPAGPSGSSLVHLSAEQLQARALERWHDQRRSATFGFLAASVVGLGVGLGLGVWWPLILTALATLHLARVVVSRDQVVREEVRRLERRQARQHRQRWPLPRSLPPGPWQR